jgi:hypothetical protein
VPRGTFPVHAYRFSDEQAEIHACAVIAFRRASAVFSRRLAIRAVRRPDLIEGASGFALSSLTGNQSVA